MYFETEIYYKIKYIKITITYNFTEGKINNRGDWPDYIEITEVLDQTNNNILAKLPLEIVNELQEKALNNYYKYNKY